MPIQYSKTKTIMCSPTQYRANTFLLVLVANTILVIWYTTLSGKVMRLNARADSRPRNAAKGEMFDSYADLYLSDESLPICIVDGFGFAENEDADAVGLLYVDTYRVFS